MASTQVPHATSAGAVPRLHFTVSLDEEHVTLVVDSDGQRFDLGERIHHYTLLLLVRAHLAQARDGINRSDAGWIDSGALAKMLGMEPSHLNVQLFRLRGQMIAAGLLPAVAGSLVERRRGQLRAGAMAVAIAQGAHVAFADLSGAQAPSTCCRAR